MTKLVQRHLITSIVLVLAISVAGLATWAIRDASSQAPSGVADFTKLTPRPFPGYPSTITPADLTEPTCQAPANERPQPDLPPLSCRISSGEPPPGVIATASALQRPTVAPLQPSGASIADNQLFRYTITVPDGWYSNMRPEGGQFQLSDPPATAETLDPAKHIPGGIVIIFGARKYFVPDVPGGFVPLVEERLQRPNVSFGGVPGVIWDEGPGEGAAAQLRAAFRKDDVVFEALALISGNGRSQEAVAGDIAAARAVLLSITPY